MSFSLARVSRRRIAGLGILDCLELDVESKCRC